LQFMEVRKLPERMREIGVEACEQYKYIREKAASADQPKPMLLGEDIA
jgi:hypothetical protein